jgi:hypothetical protein
MSLPVSKRMKRCNAALRKNRYRVKHEKEAAAWVGEKASRIKLGALMFGELPMDPIFSAARFIAKV